jgi:hypothetical protein
VSFSKASTRACGGLRTVAKHQQLVAVSGSDLAQQRQQVVRDTLGVLAHDTAGVGAAGVEVPQVGAVPLLKGLVGLLQVLPLRRDEVLDDVLDHGLGAAVRVRGADRAVLGDGDHVLEPGRVTVDRSGRGEDNVGDIVLGHGAEEGDGAADIDAVVLERDLGGLANGLDRELLSAEAAG